LIVIDASATVALLLNESGALSTSDQLNDLNEQPLIVPSHWAAEVGNALVINVRRRRIESSDIDGIIGRLLRLGVQIEPAPSFSDVSTIARQAVEIGLTYYDAAYVHTAQTRQARLLTLDARMRNAAARLDIPLFIW
jgi:predicted nucleic acid-binding protein